MTMKLPHKIFIIFCLLADFSIIYAVKKCPKCGKNDYEDNYNYCTKCPDQRLLTKVQVPNVVGKEKNNAISLLKDNGFVVISEIEFTIDENKVNKVIGQYPKGTIWVDEGSKITVKVSIATRKLHLPKWIERIKSYKFWPVDGKCALGISIGDIKNTVIDSLGVPDSTSEYVYNYNWQDNKLNIFFLNGRVDTISLFMDTLTRKYLNPAINLIINQLNNQGQTADKQDASQKCFYKKGITFVLDKDSVIGFKIFAPKTEPHWISILKSDGIDLPNLTICRLSIGMYSDSINIILGQPDSVIKNMIIYEYFDNKLVFTNVGGEIDTIQLFISRDLLITTIANRFITREALVNTYPDFTQANDRELIYNNHGFAVSFNKHGLLKNLKMFPKEYNNMILIPEGTFKLGITKKDAKLIEKFFGFEKDEMIDAMPQKVVYLKSFYIDKYEVTNRQFQKFITATNYNPEGDWKKAFKPGKENHPVVAVTWNDAKAYAVWAGKRLPNELEWEKAARCSLGYWFPWGNTTDDTDVAEYANLIYTGLKTTVPVDSFEKGKSSYGVFNMAGNVWEWCSNIYLSDYYKNLTLFNQNIDEDKISVNSPQSVRGGSYSSNISSILSPFRFFQSKNSHRWDLGFRCVKDIKR